jgi:3'-5' exoribonuclease
MTAEAFAIHHLDNLDAKLHAFWRDVANDADPARRWTGFNKMFGGSLYKGLDEPADEEEEDEGRAELKGGL